MNKKQTIKKTAALLMGLAIAMGTTSCGFITTDTQKDLNQTVATVSIADELQDAEKFKAFGFTGEIKKRELISYYMTIGYQYVQSYGYSKEDTYNMLLNALVNREILGQVAAEYFLDKNDNLSWDGYKAFRAAELAKDGVKDTVIENFIGEGKLYEDVLKLKYILTNDGADSKEYDVAEYTLKKNINDAIDSLESSYITDDEEHDHSDTRTLPTGVKTEVEDYCPVGYDVYTGRNAADSIKDYEKVSGSTVASRQKAYNAFLTNLQEYNLVGDAEDTSSVTNLEYYYVELVSLLEQRLINNYYKALEEDVNLNLDDAYVTGKYNEAFNQNKRAYEGDPSAFAKAMDSASADSFLLYAPTAEGKTFGYVYNILLPFSTSQTVAYTEAKNMDLSEAQLFAERRDIAANISAKDLRTSWISEHDHANYYDDTTGKFFVDDSGKYESLSHYLGNYAFNGTVSEDRSEVTANKVENIDAFMTIFETEIKNVLPDGASVSGTKDAAYENGKNYYKTDAKTGKEVIDYSKFVYYSGKVNFSDTQTAAGFFDETTEQYKALSAVNELMFAYSTDTGCLNTYMGYSVSPYGTNFVKEFEYAAQEVVKEGVGSYKVCLTDYGWHIIYCSFSYTASYMGADGDVYGGYVHADKDTEGTFSNLYYEYVKESAYSNYTTEQQNKTLKAYDNDTCVTRYEKRYSDLFED